MGFRTSYEWDAFIVGSVIICYVRKQEFPAGGSSCYGTELCAGPRRLGMRRCQCPLEQVKVQVGYLGSAFDVSLPRCPSCGLTMIPKSLAEGKMAEVEALLEDK